ncbi:SWIM zinc finger family protein [Streptomyces sp. NPDC005573]|uniref:SWIM zinc finger family protein n=1 Tax=Streptomyces sp. NPDC005573 TaxID=3156890 RepID=UPI0033BD8D5E
MDAADTADGADAGERGGSAARRGLGSAGVRARGPRRVESGLTGAAPEEHGRVDDLPDAPTRGPGGPESREARLGEPGLGEPGFGEPGLQESARNERAQGIGSTAAPSALSASAASAGASGSPGSAVPEAPLEESGRVAASAAVPPRALDDVAPVARIDHRDGLDALDGDDDTAGTDARDALDRRDDTAGTDGTHARDGILACDDTDALDGLTSPDARDRTDARDETDGLDGPDALDRPAHGAPRGEASVGPEAAAGSWGMPLRALEGIDPLSWRRPGGGTGADVAPAPRFGPAGPAPAAPPQVPATMATPHRDGDLRRTFPAFGPRTGVRDAEAFAGTWWGNAWADALERQALDAGRLSRGRGYADLGKVDAITVTPGQVLAYVRGSRPRPYRVQVRLRTLDDADWERFLDAAADRPGHIAALLDKELPQSLADCGVPLLPGPGDLVPHCSCPDAGRPCKHAAALCYQTARLLDADPFVLLLLRGRGERELLDALSRRSAARAARAAREREPEPLPGVRAAEALDAARRLPPLPAPLPVPPHPEQPPAYPSVPGGPDPFALDQLATEAAARAHALLAAGVDPVAGLTLWQDAVRLAAARPGSGLTAATRALYATLAAATDRTTGDLARAVAAWRQGGSFGLDVLEEAWDPPAGRFDRARPLLLAADLPAFRPWRNRLTHPLGRVQLRLGRDGLWYAYESEPGQDDWWPRGTPDLDPVGALTGSTLPGDL